VTLAATYTNLCIDCAPNTPVLNGTVNGNGTPIAGYFQYGTNTNYGTNTSPQFYGQANYSVQSFSSILTYENLISNTLYHYRIVAFNGVSEGFGQDQTFTSPP